MASATHVVNDLGVTARYESTEATAPGKVATKGFSAMNKTLIATLLVLGATAGVLPARAQERAPLSNDASAIASNTAPKRVKRHHHEHKRKHHHHHAAKAVR